MAQESLLFQDNKKSAENNRDSARLRRARHVHDKKKETNAKKKRSLRERVEYVTLL